MNAKQHIIAVATILLSLLSGQILSQKSNTEYHQQIIQFLASDSMQGRGVATFFDSASAEFIKEKMESTQIGKVKFHSFSFIQPFTKETIHSNNVYLYQDNKASKTILIGAHYDHLGLGAYKSLSYQNKGQVHNGADDNASGVALMLAMASNIKVWGQKKYNYLFVAYSAHELGLFGSKAFYPFIKKKIKPLYLVINFDMVGRLDPKEKSFIIYGYNSISSLSNFFSNHLTDFKVWTDENDKIMETDGQVFAQNKIPTISFSTGSHLDYHKISDDEQYINYEGLQKIQDYLQDFLKSLP